MVKVILSWEEPCELSAGLPGQGQLLSHWGRCGRSFCGFSAGEDVKKGQLHPISAAGWAGPAGDAAELALSGASRHCLLFEQLWLVQSSWPWAKWEGFVGTVSCAACAPGSAPCEHQWDHFPSWWLPPFLFCSSRFTVWTFSAHSCSHVTSLCFCSLGEALTLETGSSCNIYGPQRRHLWTLSCISRADWLSNLSLKTSFPPLLELFSEPFRAFQLSFWSENPRHGYVFPAANGGCAALPLGSLHISTPQDPVYSQDCSKRSSWDSTITSQALGWWLSEN